MFDAFILRVDGSYSVESFDDNTVDLDYLHYAADCSIIEVVDAVNISHYLASVGLPYRAVIVIDDCGKLLRKRPNLLATGTCADYLRPGDFIAGQALLCLRESGYDGDDLVLCPDYVSKWLVNVLNDMSKVAVDTYRRSGI